LSPPSFGRFQRARIERRELAGLFGSGLRVGAAERDQADPFKLAARAPHLGILGDEVTEPGLGLQVLALEVDEQLARAGIGEVGNRLFARSDSCNLNRPDLVGIFVEVGEAEDAERARVGGHFLD
jgi:hypothetical protein